jgi:hypothetical protein
MTPPHQVKVTDNIVVGGRADRKATAPFGSGVAQKLEFAVCAGCIAKKKDRAAAQR